MVDGIYKNSPTPILICVAWDFDKTEYQLRLIPHQPILHCPSKTGPCITVTICYSKSWNVHSYNIKKIYINRGHIASIIKINVQNAQTPVQRYCLHSSIDNCLLYSIPDCTQTLQHLFFEIFQKWFKIIFFYSSDTNLFNQSVSSKIFKLMKMFNNKIWFSLHRPTSLISIIHSRSLPGK